MGRHRAPRRSRVSKSTKDYTLLRLGLAQRLYSGKTATYRLRFDLPDPGGAATRDLRIGDSLASFPVWGVRQRLDPGRHRHRRLPEGLHGRRPGRLDPGADDRRDRPGRSSAPGRLPNPLSFFAYLVADRPGAYARATRTATVGGSPVALTRPVLARRHGLVQARRGLMAQALPVLGERIGLAWPQTGP